MKTHKHLYPLITDFGNLHLAFKRAARGKRSRWDVSGFEYDLEDNLLELQDELRAQTYRPGPYHNFTVYDPKPRLISAAPFRDRVVHHALCNVVEPLFEQRFIDDSYACRVGKGTHAALDRAQDFARRYPYVLKCDVQQFFPSMDHAVLREQFRRVIRDGQTLWLMDQILDGGVHPCR
jgi:retron-type reverse transcriptase